MTAPSRLTQGVGRESPLQAAGAQSCWGLAKKCRELTSEMSCQEMEMQPPRGTDASAFPDCPMNKGVSVCRLWGEKVPEPWGRGLSTFLSDNSEMDQGDTG
jgi:hypothetical protein